MFIEKARETIQEASRLKNEVITPFQIDFIKYIVQISVLVVPILSFVPLNSSACKALFHCLLIALTVCILTGTMLLYIVLIQHRKWKDDLIKDANRMLEQADARRQATFGKYKHIIYATELLCLLSFFTSIILIVTIVW